MNNRLKSQLIIKRLETPVKNRYFVKKRIAKSAPAKEIIIALRNSKNKLTREILCEIVGWRRLQSALPELINCLEDRSPSIRSSAVEALGHLRNPNAGEAVYRCFISRSERDKSVKHMGALTLGACRYYPAIPVLIKALKDEDSVLRACSAWALGYMRAEESIRMLKEVLIGETDKSAQEKIKQAIENIEK